MPPSLIVRQRQLPVSSPPGAGGASRTPWMIARSEADAPCSASSRPLALDSESLARRFASKADAVSCHPANAGVAIRPRPSAIAANSDVFARRMFYPLGFVLAVAVAVLGRHPALEI